MCFINILVLAFASLAAADEPCGDVTVLTSMSAMTRKLEHAKFHKREICEEEDGERSQCRLRQSF